MNLKQFFTHIQPFVRPYRGVVVLTLVLTFIGSFAAQVNAWVLRYTVDSINLLVEEGKGLKEGFGILTIITVILFSKEVINVLVQFGQKYYGEKLRIYVAKDLAQSIIEKVLIYKMAFFTSTGNESGKLQTRIDRGVESITRMIQNF